MQVPRSVYTFAWIYTNHNWLRISNQPWLGGKVRKMSYLLDWKLYLICNYNSMSPE